MKNLDPTKYGKIILTIPHRSHLPMTTIKLDDGRELLVKDYSLSFR